VGDPATRLLGEQVGQVVEAVERRWDALTVDILEAVDLEIGRAGDGDIVLGWEVDVKDFVC
jgi:hypothetical protein